MREPDSICLGKICNVCGAVGFPELIVTCGKCNEAHEHAYCMRDHSLELSGTWFCERCNLSTGPIFDIPTSEILNSPDSVNQPRPFSSNSLDLLKSSSKPPVHPQIYADQYMKCIKRQKTSFIPTEEAIKLMSAGVGKEFNAQSRPGHNLYGGSNTKNLNSKVVTKNRNFEYYPAKSAIWMGRIKVSAVTSTDYFCDICGHLASKVHRKAYLFSGQLPKVIEFRSAPLCDLNIFQGYNPCREDIALYFFPQNERSRSDYIHLLERVKVHNLVLKSYVGSAELLLFSSTKLLEECQMLEGEHFLWGVFHFADENPKDGEDGDVCRGRTNLG